MRSTMRFGFTLIEMLCVVAIIATVAGLLLPALASAKKQAKMGVSMSNLRQCEAALLIYTEGETRSTDYPNRDTACRVLNSGIAYDPADYWRSGPDVPSPYESMVGSYGYSNADLCFEGATGKPCPCTENVFGEKFPLLASIFYDSQYFPKDDYIKPGKWALSPAVPERALVVWQDGHVKMEHVSNPRHSNFCWAVLFHFISDSYDNEVSH